MQAVQPTRSLARHPLFQVMFVLQNTPAGELTLPGLRASAEPLPCEVAKFDLTLDLAECLGPGRDPQGIEGALEYSRDLFEQGTAESMAARLVRLLEAAAAKPDAPVHRLDILDACERHTLLEEFNATSHPLPETTLPELFEAQAARTPEAVAVIDGADCVTYAELNSRANRLAHHLIGLGVGPERWWECAWSARSTWWWRSWAFSRRAPPTCPWTQNTRRRGWQSCLPTREHHSC